MSSPQYSGGGYSSPAQQQPVQYNTGSASISTLQAWASHQQYLDVYQVNAYYTGTAQRGQYVMSFWKVATCFGLQFVGIFLLMQDQWDAYLAQDIDGSCTSESTYVRYVGFFFATYITIFCTEQIRTLNRYGMYGWGESQPEFVNSLWVGVGLWVNLFSLVVSWVVSCIIIFLSPDILEMVLNAVAVSFMLTIDDEIVGDSDYNRILNEGGGSRSMCSAIDGVFAKIGGLLLKIHPCWQRRISIRGYSVELCDILLCPGMIVFPLVVLFCYPFSDEICLYEYDGLCFESEGLTDIP